MRTGLSALDLEARIPVWEALSDLWLDTELQTEDLEHIARIIAMSPYDLREIREICDYELMPVLWSNLLSVTGVWSGFDPAWLARECARNLHRQHVAGFRCYWRFLGYFLSLQNSADLRWIWARVQALRTV